LLCDSSLGEGYYIIPKKRKMLEFLFTMALSTAPYFLPLLLYTPPIRSFNTLVEAMEEINRELRLYTNRWNPRLQVGWSRILDCIPFNTR